MARVEGGRWGALAAKTFVFSREEVARLHMPYTCLFNRTRKSSGGGSRLPWSIAMRYLGTVKFQVNKDSNPISQELYKKMLTHKL